MAKNLSSVEFTNELENSKRIIGELKNDALSYMASYQTMKFHERARQHQKIVRNFGLVQQFVLRTKIGLINNTGQKFEFENLRQTFQSLFGRWRKFESLIEGGSVD